MSDIGVNPSCDNLKTLFLCLSVKYILYPSTAKDSGFEEIPYSPAKLLVAPSTLLEAIKLALPSALYKASLLANTSKTLSSQNANTFVSLVFSICIEP